MPVALTVRSGLAGGVSCAVRSWKDGMARKRSTMTGPTVQTTSMAVLWLVLEGTGLALSRNLTTTMISRRRTKRVIGMMNHRV
ncbi:hypothetical protein D9M72_578730 [compost metagenome]